MTAAYSAPTLFCAKCNILRYISNDGWIPASSIHPNTCMKYCLEFSSAKYKKGWDNEINREVVFSFDNYGRQRTISERNNVKKKYCFRFLLFPFILYFLLHISVGGYIQKIEGLYLHPHSCYFIRQKRLWRRTLYWAHQSILRGELNLAQSWSPG